jgi:hypothetical protein
MRWTAVLVAAVVAVAVAAGPGAELVVTYDVSGTYYPDATACHGVGSPRYTIAVSDYTSGAVVNVTDEASGDYVTLSFDCAKAGVEGLVVTWYDPVNPGAVELFQPSPSSARCVGPYNATTLVARMNVGCQVHAAQQVVQAPSTWTGAFTRTLAQRTPDTEQCRLEGAITLETQAGPGNTQAAVLKGKPTNSSACYAQFQNGISLQSPYVADLSKLYRWTVSVNGYIFTVNRVAYEGAVEVFYDLPYTPPNERFTCDAGSDCQPYYFGGSAVIGTTLFLVFGIPFLVIACLGFQQRRSRTHDE